MARSTFIQLSVLLVLAISREAFTDEPEKIVGGKRASKGEFPYQVSLQEYGKHVCGGTLISHEHVLTAAHCVYGTNATYISIVTGTIYHKHGGQRHKVKNIICHSGYVNSASPVQNDIAVIALEQPIVPSSLQEPISMASSHTPANTSAVVSGWGLTSRPGLLSPTLRKAAMTVLSHEECESRVGRIIPSKQLCAYQRYGVGTCTSDSGGPLVANGELIGVVSWVVPCGVGYPDGYEGVFEHRDFISEAIRLSSQ